MNWVKREQQKRLENTQTTTTTTTTTTDCGTSPDPNVDPIPEDDDKPSGVLKNKGATVKIDESQNEVEFY